MYVYCFIELEQWPDYIVKRWADYIVKEDLLGSQDDPEEYGSNVLIPNWSEWTRLVVPDALVISRLELYNILLLWCQHMFFSTLCSSGCQTHLATRLSYPKSWMGRGSTTSHTEAQLEPYQHLPCEHTHLWDNMSSACMLHNLCMFNVS